MCVTGALVMARFKHYSDHLSPYKKNVGPLCQNFLDPRLLSVLICVPFFSESLPADDTILYSPLAILAIDMNGNALSSV